MSEKPENPEYQKPSELTLGTLASLVEEKADTGLLRQEEGDKNSSIYGKAIDGRIVKLEYQEVEGSIDLSIEIDDLSGVEKSGLVDHTIYELGGYKRDGHAEDIRVRKHQDLWPIQIFDVGREHFSDDEVTAAIGPTDSETWGAEEETGLPYLVSDQELIDLLRLLEASDMREDKTREDQLTTLYELYFDDFEEAA